jgi:hypothetical protein
MVKERSLCYPISYGDRPSDDNNRLSDRVVPMVKSKKFQDTLV